MGNHSLNYIYNNPVMSILDISKTSKPSYVMMQINSDKEYGVHIDNLITTKSFAEGLWCFNS